MSENIRTKQSVGGKLISASNGGFTFREALILQLSGNSALIRGEKNHLSDSIVTTFHYGRTAETVITQADAIIELLDKE